jgi:hypothetical protein
MPPVYLYPEARALFPRLPAQAVAALAQDVLRRYRATRYAVLWTRAASLASYRFPVALTLPTQAWSLHEEQGQWSVSVRLSEARWRLRLRGGAPMRRQLQRLRQIAEGQAERGSLAIYESRSSRGDSNAPRVMAKIAAWLPKTASGDRSLVVHARTDEQSLLAAEPRWRIDPAPIRSVLAADARRRSSLLANLQSTRASGGRTEGIRRALDELSDRTRRRLFESCRTYAAHLAAHAEACGACEVRYDDRVRPALSHFPWELLRRRIAEKLDERGIRFVNGHAATRTEPSGGMGSTLLSAAFHKYGDPPRAARRGDASPAECHRLYERQVLGNQFQPPPGWTVITARHACRSRPFTRRGQESGISQFAAPPSKRRHPPALRVVRQPDDRRCGFRLQAEGCGCR